ncbi:MAG TPA: tyrosine-type recombinase/integrase [Magnetospirillum sp.]|nr:tyrosine-type recombinase/integrase [Magnetospirillum sp.]
MLRLKKYPKRSPNWFVRGTVAGIELFESTGTPDRARAEAYRLKREREVYDAARLGEVRPATFADAVTAYLNKGKPGRFLTPLLDHFKERPLPEIGQAEIDEAARLLYPGAKASTLNRQVYGPMVAVMRSAVRSRLPGAYVPIWERRDEERPQVSPADDAHLDKLLPHLADGLMRLVWLMTYTGLRTGEALRVRPGDIRDGYAVVGKTKNGEPRMVPIPEGWEYPAGGWGYSTTQGVGKALRAAHKAAGLPYRDGHELGRHAFAARFLKAGGNIKRLKEAGGWKKLSVVDDAYGHLEMTDVHDFMRGLSRNRAKPVKPPPSENDK